jgi:hypothetical protein
MSSSNVQTEQQSPPAKKAKTEPAAALDPKVTGIDDVTAAALRALQNQTAAMKETAAMETAAMKAEFNERLKTVEDRLNNVEDRLSHITKAFEPATQNALFETAIYHFVDIHPGWEDEESKIKHGMAILCSRVMDRLLHDTDNKVIQWQGPSTKIKPNKANHRPFPKELVGPLILRGLAGLEVYIESESIAAIKEWNPAGRNTVCHNGTFLDSMFSSPNGKSGEGGHRARKDNVKVSRRLFEDRAKESKQVGSPTTIELRVKAVLAALQKKEISTVASGEEDAVCKELTALSN